MARAVSQDGVRPVRAALYARCSTVDQSVALQVDELREYARQRGIRVVAEYVDEGASGSNPRRPQLDALLADAHRRRFDALLVWKLDRLGRSLSHLIGFVEQLGALQVDLISLRDPGLDTTGPTGRLIFHVIGAVAEFERDLIRERTRAGLAAARRRGRRIGRPRVYVPLARAAELLEQGRPMAAVARELGVARSTLRRALGQVAETGPRPASPTA